MKSDYISLDRRGILKDWKCPKCGDIISDTISKYFKECVICKNIVNPFRRLR